MLLFAGSATGILGASYTAGGAWVTSALTGATSVGTSLTVDSTGRGIGVYTAATGGVVGSTVWSGGAWSAPAAITASAVARSQPFIDATGGTTAHLVYQDSSYKYWYLANAGTWSTTPEAMGGTNQNYGPVSATIAALGANATTAFIDGQSPQVNYAAQDDRTGGTWAARADITGPESFNVSPVIIPLSAGPELMMLFVTQTGSQVMVVTRNTGSWSTPVAIAGALTNDRPALAPLPGGGAIVAFKGTDGNLYWSTYTGGAWSTVAPFATPNVAVDTSPAVTHGIGGDVAEIAYVSAGVAYHARLSGSTWGAPVLVGGTGLTGVAIAAAP